MKYLFGLVFISAFLACSPHAAIADSPPGRSFSGTQSCRECHENFYRLWEPSHHGKAMQSYSEEFAARQLSPHSAPISILGREYQAQVGPGQGWVVETGADGTQIHLIKEVLGGKNVYYFLTAQAKGRLQTLPLAYDVHQKKWFDTAKSGLRHAGGSQVSWRDPGYTFNTSCHSCHVSQVRLNYDLEQDTYETTWREPGINCETCHGPGDEHIMAAKKAEADGAVLEDWKIDRGGRDFSAEQNNAVCSSCHAKMIPLTSSFVPGEKFFDHFDLALLEHPDYYPDGRDLGENYTYTTWLMSPCLKSGKLDCLKCHTSSGRFRQKKDPNQACAPCHAQKVENPTRHTMHKADSQGSLCISCHMPMTSFARMNRSDHSMLPPAPASTIAFGSPNACNNCHTDKDAAWSDDWVRKWRARDYQAGVIRRGELIKAARERDWSRLDDMLAYLQNPAREEVSAASLVRLLRSCPLPQKWTGIIKASYDASPLVRAAAAESLRDHPSRGSLKALADRLDDEYRLVRIRAAGSLFAFPRAGLTPEQAQKMARADKELQASLVTRPDLWSSHYNMGNYLMERRQLRLAVQAFQTAIRQEPRAVMARVNLAMAYARQGQGKQAENQLNQALATAPDNAAANFNMGLLAAEMQKPLKAEQHLRAALKSDPQMAPAAYNLGLLIYDKNPAEAVDLLTRAWKLNPSPDYAFTLAYLLNKSRRLIKATELLRAISQRWPAYGQAYLLLAEIQAGQGDIAGALATLRGGLTQPAMPPGERMALKTALGRYMSPPWQSPGKTE